MCIRDRVKDLGFLVAGDGWWREVKRVNRYSLSTPDPALALPTIVHTGTAPDYQLILRPVVDPGNDTLLVAYDLQGAGARLLASSPWPFGSTQARLSAP